MALQRSVKPQFSLQPQSNSQEIFADFSGRSSSSCSSAGSRSHSQLPFLAGIISLSVGLIVCATWTLLKGSPATSTNLHHMRLSFGGKKFLYWGNRIDCPGRNCLICGGLGHQESSLRCALEEALYLNRTFVLPSKLCLTKKHNAKVALGQSTTRLSSLQQRWDSESCSVKSLYDVGLLSKTVPVILDSSAEWKGVVELANSHIVSQAYVQGTGREELRTNSHYNDKIIVNRTANPLAWSSALHDDLFRRMFMECKNRRNHSALLVPYSLLQAVAAHPLREVAQKIIEKLGDFDALHVRRGDKVKLRKDRFGVYRTTYPHLDRDTQPLAILNRIKDWIPEGRTLYIASDERQPGYFDPIATRYNVVRPLNFSTLLRPVVHNNYQLFMIDRLVLAGAKVLVKTWKENPADLCLSDDSKKSLKRWEIPVHTFNDSQVHPAQ